MVLLTIVTNHPIEKPSYIRLLSASIYNSWNSLKEGAVISTKADSNGTTTKANLLPEHYTIDVLVNEFNNLHKNNSKFILSAVANTPVSSMTIFNQNNVTFSNNLLKLLGIERTLLITFVKQLISPSTYFVHCDLIETGKTYSIENLRLSWRDSIFAGSLLKRFTTKQHSNMFCVTRQQAIMV